MEILGLVDVPLYFPLALVVVVLVYIHGTWTFNFFKKQGIPGPTPFPVLGNAITLHMMFFLPQIQGVEPKVRICVWKVSLIPSPLSLGVFFLDDDHWRRVRSIITPSFSSGKLRKMCAAINDCSKILTTNLSKTTGKTEGVIVKEYFGAYTMDVISRTAFGFFPPVVGIVRMIEGGLFPIRIMRFFQANILEMIKQRQTDSEENREQRIDFLQLLVDAEITDDTAKQENSHTSNGQASEKHTVRRLTTDEIVGQGILFFIAGNETTASTLNFASYSLAMNPDVQEKAYTEFTEMLGNEEPNHDNIGQPKYLDNVIIETLRLYPPAIVLNRRASETIQIKGLTIYEGQTVFIPTFALHRDPNLFKDPDSFKPERQDEKSNPLSFLAFGYGPRICIGMRLALLEAKIALVHVLRAVKIERMPDTPDVLKFKITGVLQPEKDIKLKVSARC